MTDLIKLEIEHLLNDFKLVKPKRTGSFIITFFGDIMALRQGDVWLGTVIEILHNFGFNAGLIRTTMTRLVADGWLERRHVGRNSFYKFQDKAAREAQLAATKIYQIPQDSWGKKWQQVLFLNTEQNALQNRSIVKKKLVELGFAALNNQLMLRPQYLQADEAQINNICMQENAVFGQNLNIDCTQDQYYLLAENWKLTELNNDYGNFIKKYSTIAKLLEENEILQIDDALILRLLLIHDFRKLVLKDPQLPQIMQNKHWFGHKTHELVAKIYKKIANQSDLALKKHEKLTEIHKLPPINSKIAVRFKRL